MDLIIINPDNYSNVSVRSVLKFYRSKYPNKLIIGHININYIRNKFNILRSILSEMLDVLVIIETRPDDSFPEQQLYINFISNFMSFRLDRKRHDGG